MILVDYAAFFPSTCVCGEAHGRMADTGIEKYAERLYLCERCVRDAARLFEMVERTEHEDALVAGIELEQKVEALELHLAELIPVRDAIDRAALRWDLDPDDEPVRRAAV